MNASRGRFLSRGVCLLLVSNLALIPRLVVAAAGDSSPVIVERGPHSRKWERTTTETLPDGQTIERKTSYVELSTGMHYLKDGQWTESKEEIELIDGFAVARQGQIRVTFAANLNSAGAVDMLAPDHMLPPNQQRFRSHLVCLAFTDYASGVSVAIAEARDTTGAVLPPNQVIYQDAFAGDCAADVRYTYTKDGFEQDIILLTAPPSPAVWGLNPETTRLEVFTEFIEAPEPTITSVVLRQETDPEARQLMKEPDLIDQILDFGAIRIGPGQAFPLGQNDPFGDQTIPTGKSFERIDGRLYLIEKVDYVSIREQLGQLPPSASVDPNRKTGILKPGGPMMAALLPARPTAKPGTWRADQYAKADSSRKGFVIDYIALNSSMTNQVLKGDTTFLITNTVGLYGTTVLEGTVLKFATNAWLNIHGPLDCRTDPYRPATFVSKDENAIGEIISGSTGTPLNSFAKYPLYLHDTSATYNIHDIRVFHSQYGVTLDVNVKADFSNLQVGQGLRGISWAANTTISCRNFLFFDLTNAFYSAGPGTNRAEHGTIHRVDNFLNNTNSGRLVALTNSLLIAVTNNLVYAGTNDVVKSLDDTGFFQTVGSGAHYLVDSSTNRNAGTTNINPDLLTALRQRTTYPPWVLSNNITASTNFSEAAWRDTDTPDLGFHYSPIDFVANGISISNATVTLNPGVVFGFYGSGAGLRLLEGAGLIAEGTPLNFCRFIRYNLSQEQANTNWSSTTIGPSIYTSDGDTANWEARFRFTDWSAPAAYLGLGDGHFYAYGNAFVNGPRVSFRDSQIRGGAITALAPEAAFTNCLFERANVLVYSWASDARNCTFIGGKYEVDGTFAGPHEVADCLFDRTYFDTNAWFGTVNHHNAYVTNETRLQPAGTNDVILTNAPVYQTNWFGRHYFPTNDGMLSTLLNVGSRPANEAGLYHFTTLTNQMRETNSVVDIGYHSLALSNGLAMDFDSDGLADYLEDANGNGSRDGTETSWLHSDTDYDGRSDADEYTDGTDPLNSGSVKLVRLGHWRFDDSSWTGDEGQLPNLHDNLGLPVSSWSSNAVYITNLVYTQLGYREIENNGRPNINCRNGSIRFWFKPDWTSFGAGGGSNGAANYASFVSLGSYADNAVSGFWGMQLREPSGTNLLWESQSNVVDHYIAVPSVSFVAGRWHQMVMTYSPTNAALFFNGQVMTNYFGWDDRPQIVATKETYNTTAGGIFNYPPPDIRAAGFRFGCNWEGGGQAAGQFEELETFNHPLTPQQIAREFHTLAGVPMATNDFDYDGRSDFLEAYVDGTLTNDSASVAGCRLAYWRFNGTLTNLLGDALQAPIYTNGIQLAASWSSNALVIPAGSTGRIVYRDVETNGWANFNCRSGAVRFWFRPKWTGSGLGADGSFLFMGNANSASETTGRWDLGLTSSGGYVRFRTATNGSATTLFEAPVNFTSNQWCQLVLNYGPNAVALYANGSLVTNRNVGVSQWPALVDRTNGLALGNNHAGNRSVNGDLDEVETFNRQLTAAEIQRNFDSMQASDNDLNGVPDMLEDPVLSAPVPFAGFPFVITGTIEAEQFDRGGQDVSYHSNGGNSATNDYRASAMQIVTNTTDIGAGFLVDNLRANEWLKYTLDVRVAQNYAVDARVAGLGTGGVFHVEFATNATSAAYTDTGPLTLLSTNWTNVIRTLLPLRAGTNLMKVVMDTNSASGAVARLNYISIYPSWIEGATNLVANTNVTGLTSNDSSWTAATNNAARIQAAISSLSTTGTVTIPAGTYYLAQKLPQEGDGDARDNAAVYVSKSNLKIQGAGRTNTVLIAHNRATALFYFGVSSGLIAVSVTNVTLSELGVEGRPHLVAVSDAGSGGFTNCWEDGIVTQGAGLNLGSLLVAVGANGANLIRNLLVTNCLFRNASVVHFVIPTYVRDIAFRSCEFVLRDGSNGAVYFRTNASPCHTNASVPYPWTGVSVLVRAPGCENLLMFDCAFNGNPGMTSVNTNLTVDASDGIFWAQAGGNWFVGRCSITNYGLEGVQFGSGPAAATGNEFHTLVSLGAVNALYAYPFWDGTPTASTNDYAFYLVGNNVSGGRSGYKGEDSDFGDPKSEADVHVSGNALTLFPAFPVSAKGYDGLGGAVVAGMVRRGMVSGNIMTAGEVGAWWSDGTASSVLLKNDFVSASYQGLLYEGTNGPQHRFLILRNAFNQGYRYHLRPTWEDGRAYFFGENVFKSGTNIVNPFITPYGAPVHFRY